MSKINQPNSLSPKPEINLAFAPEIEMADCGYAFHPIAGFELEVDGSVYMYSKDGNIEISLFGGELSNKTSIGELNDTLASNFLEDVDEFRLIKAGKDVIQGITGFLNEIQFGNAEEEGVGRALICSPFINQYFFLLVICSADDWESQGQPVFEALKSKITFHPQFKPVDDVEHIHDHPDLTIETYQAITPEDNFILTIEEGDVSLLLAARSHKTNDNVSLIQFVTPDGNCLYHFEPVSGTFSSHLYNHPLVSNLGEVCFYYPHTPQKTLLPGNYLFSFFTDTRQNLQEIQIIIRSRPVKELQKVDLNFWLALENDRFNNPDYLQSFISNIHQSLTQHLAPVKLAPGKCDCFFPAPDELSLFTTVNLDTDLPDCSYMIAESVNNDRALNIGLVEQLTTGNPPIQAPCQAVSSGSPGMILSSISPHACIVIGLSGYLNDQGEVNFTGLADAIIQQLLVFSGITGEGELESDILSLSPEAIHHLRYHPLFYDSD